MKIDIISDTICPWCYIGGKNFDAAIEIVRQERPDATFDVQWRPFQLHPETPKEGVDRKKSMKRKFGDGEHLKAMSETCAIWAKRSASTLILKPRKRLPTPSIVTA